MVIDWVYFSQNCMSYNIFFFSHFSFVGLWGEAFVEMLPTIASVIVIINWVSRQPPCGFIMFLSFTPFSFVGLLGEVLIDTTMNMNWVRHILSQLRVVIDLILIPLFPCVPGCGWCLCGPKSSASFIIFHFSWEFATFFCSKLFLNI